MNDTAITAIVTELQNITKAINALKQEVTNLKTTISFKK